MQQIRAEIDGLPRPGVSWVIFFEKRVFVLSRNIRLAELFEPAGGDYVFKEIGDNEISLEYFIHNAREAEILFINPWYAPPRSKSDLIRRNPALAPLKALSAEGRSYLVREELFRDTGRLDEALRDLAATMHPAVYPNREPLFFVPLPLKKLD